MQPWRFLKDLKTAAKRLQTLKGKGLQSAGPPQPAAACGTGAPSQALHFGAFALLEGPGLTLWGVGRGGPEI